MKFDTNCYLVSVGFVACLILIGCSGESANVGEQSVSDGSIDQTVGMDMAFAMDQAVPSSDSRVIPADSGSGVDLGLVDVQVTDAMIDGDAAIPLDLGSSDSTVPPPDQMVDAAMEVWMPRQTPQNPIIQDSGPSLALLIVGNNYVGLNDLCGKISSLAESANQWDSVVCEMVSIGGYRLIDHADSAASGGALDELLNAQDPTRTQFDLLILQERAQVSGFPNNQRYRSDFEQAVEEFAIRAEGLGTRTALLMPWGRPNGDPSNAALYPDYPTMQARIAQAHYDVAGEVSVPTNEVAVIEAGETWFRTYERNTNDDFTSLYLPNDHHPSDTGSWLLAAIILKRAVDMDPFSLPMVSGLPEINRWLRLRGDVVQQ